MDLKHAGTLLTPPNLKNVSCTHERYTYPLYYYIGPLDFLQALIILLLTIGIIGANLMLIFVINHRRYSPYIDPQVNALHMFNECNFTNNVIAISFSVVVRMSIVFKIY